MPSVLPNLVTTVLFTNDEGSTKETSSKGALFSPRIPGVRPNQRQSSKTIRHPRRARQCRHTWDLLTREDVDHNTIEEEGLTPLSLAARSGHDEVVKLLLRKHGVCVNSARHGDRTPISWTIEGHVGVVEILLSRRMRADAILKDAEHSYLAMEWAIL